MDNNHHLPGTADDFIENNLGLAHKEAWRFIKWIGKDEEIRFDKDDLLSIAYMGLVKAYQKFDPTRFSSENGGQIKFSTYAVPMINGELRRHIRDLGHTVRRSRDGRGINNIDSLDRELKDDENSSQTIGDTVKVESYEIEYQVIMNDFTSQLEPRLQKTYKLLVLGKTQSEIGKYFGLSQVQAGRIVNKLIDLAKQYREKGDEDMGREMSPETKLMREEVDTFAKFGAIGSYEDVAGKYGVGKGTAYSWMRKLMDEGVVKEVKEVVEVRVETAPFEIPNTPGNYEATDRIVEGTEQASGTSKEDEGGIVTEGGGEGPETTYEGKYPCFGEYEDTDIECRGCEGMEVCCVVTNNPIEQTIEFRGDYPEQYETKDDLGGLAEPEPAWTAEYAGDSASIMFTLPKAKSETPEQMWVHVAYYIGAIKQQGIRQVEEDIQARLDQILGGR